jgi:hypothetical protein
MSRPPIEPPGPRFLRFFLFGMRLPEPGADRRTQLRFVRDLELRHLFFMFIPACVIIAVFAEQDWVRIALGVVLLLIVAHLTYLTIASSER